MGGKKKREMVNGEEKVIEGTCNQGQQRKPRACGAGKEKTGGRGKRKRVNKDVMVENSNEI